MQMSNTLTRPRRMNQHPGQRRRESPDAVSEAHRALRPPDSSECALATIEGIWGARYIKERKGNIAMPELVLTEEQAKVVAGATGLIQIRDPNGKWLGRIDPEEAAIVADI